MYFQLPFCRTNEQKIKSIVNKLEEFTNNKVKFIFHWKTRKLRSLFPLKDRIKQKGDLVYKGICSCNESYIGEIKQNAEMPECRNKVEKALL